MPELPEITIFARDMHKELVGRTINTIDVLQPKVLNVPVETFQQALTGARIEAVTSRGKWLLVDTTQGWLLLSLGMGGEILLTDREHLPEKRRVVLGLEGGGSEGNGEHAAGDVLAINFWWFGYCHYATDPAEHPMVSKLGPDALGLPLEQFREMLAGRRGAIKAFLMDQSHVAGIGNVYIQTPLWRAKIHPQRAIPSLTDEEIATLWREVQAVLEEAIAAGGAAFEMNLYGKKGGWDDPFLFHFVDGAPCPVCGTPLAKIRTGSTPGYVCPGCQVL